MTEEAFDLQRATRAALQMLESLERAGVTHVSRPPAAAPDARPPLSARADDAHSAAAPRSISEQAPASEAPRRIEEQSLAKALESQMAKQAVSAARGSNLFPGDEAPAPPASERPAALQVIAREVAACTRCDELATTRTQTVFGVGNPQARLCFMGEAPGADEDRQGEPFVGRAGQLLNKIIEACTLRREDVYILNTLKCRPPGNRNPLPDETANCRGFLDRQLAVVRPEYICCLGAVAAQALLATDESIGRLRKRFHDYHGIRVLCTYHPAYLLRNPAAKKDVWEDMQLLMREMGITLPGKA
ncbi:MAG TPA: uracil-DNA glycosylase [Pirellulales bacterium]|nr:uracil-DNA glycosylase [Pirellulales bacterium]